MPKGEKEKMLLSEPLTYIISKTHKDGLGLFRIENNRYLLISGVQTFEMDSNLKDDYYIIEGEDVIPFIIYHNWCNEHSAYLSLLDDKDGKSWQSLYIKGAHIDNKINSNITIEELAHKYIDDLDVRLKLVRRELIDISDEIYEHLVENALKKFIP
jgi:hypothetical protein